MFLVLLITITYWLFFAVWIVEMKEKEYEVREEKIVACSNFL